MRLLLSPIIIKIYYWNLVNAKVKIQRLLFTFQVFHKKVFDLIQIKISLDYATLTDRYDLHTCIPIDDFLKHD